MERSLCCYVESLHILTNTYTHNQNQARCKESVVSSLFNREYSIITNKDDLTKENAK